MTVPSPLLHSAGRIGRQRCPSSRSARSSQRPEKRDQRTERGERMSPVAGKNVGHGGVRFSTFVPARHDSESCDADPTRTPLAVPDRLARDQPDRPVPARRRAMRALQATARTPCRSAQRRQWRVVGHRCAALARWPRPSPPTTAGVRAAGGNPNDAPPGLSRDRASQSRSELQRPAMAQSRGPLSALPHDPRRGRASSAPLVERLSTPGSRRPVHRPLQLEPVFARISRNTCRGAATPARALFNPLRMEARPPLVRRFKVVGRLAHDRSAICSWEAFDGKTTTGC